MGNLQESLHIRILFMFIPCIRIRKAFVPHIQNSWCNEQNNFNRSQHCAEATGTRIRWTLTVFAIQRCSHPYPSRKDSSTKTLDFTTFGSLWAHLVARTDTNALAEHSVPAEKKQWRMHHWNREYVRAETSFTKAILSKKTENFASRKSTFTTDTTPV